MLASLIGGLIGCAPGVLTPEEADVVYEAVSSVNADTYATIYAFSAPDGEDAGGSPAKGLQWFEDAGGGRLDGTVEGPGSWTGTVQVEGTYVVTLVTADSWSVVWALAATYVDVNYGDLVLDGDLRWNLSATADRGVYTHASMVTGDMVAGGAATGAGALDFGTTVSLAGGRYQVATEGTVGGHDISSSYDATTFGL
ncbi:MAG: hypothetical protein V4850_00705 [Myxococcota bacterium]